MHVVLKALSVRNVVDHTEWKTTDLMAWCCKANPKSNPSRETTAVGALCPYIFKCLNCKGEHSANNCHDLANWLSHYLYFFSFLFLFTTTRWSAGKYHVTLSQCHNGVMEGHRWSRHSHSGSHDESNMRTMGE